MKPGIRIWLGDDGIMRVEYPRDCCLTLEDVQELNRRHREISVRRRPLLNYAESVAAAEYEAQQFASSQEVVEVVSALAIIVKSFFTRAMADIFMRFSRPPYPTRVFTNETDALAWLETYREQIDEDNDERGESA